tara:strand:+ start:1734 stop:2903 length:1170 start_codon:yes stop_codon:yes gene_type:complete
MNITVIGAGYVGLSNAVLLSTKYNVTCYDVDEDKIKSINKRISPIKDELLQKYLETKKIKLKASHDFEFSISRSDFIIISTPTNFDPSKDSFDTSTIDQTLKKISQLKSSSNIIIKSTVPVGYTVKVNKKYTNLRIYFSPEFLREGKAVYDNLYPSRIIIGNKDKYSQKFINLFKDISLKKNTKIIFMSSSEAESVKLFSNSYLATRVAFFNELDSFCLENGFDTRSVIDGISSDLRIGEGYNNPSFGFGGYCLPKDTKQLKSSFKSVPNALIRSLTPSNQRRKQYIANDILKQKAKNIGIYLLAMKKDSDNFRESSIIDIIRLLKKNGRNIFIYEPTIDRKKTLFGCEIINNFETFARRVDLIITNRASRKLSKVSTKVYTRDIYGEN